MIMASHSPQLIIIIKNSKIALKAPMHFTFKYKVDSFMSVRKLPPNALSPSSFS